MKIEQLKNYENEMQEHNDLNVSEMLLLMQNAKDSSGAVSFDRLFETINHAYILGFMRGKNARRK